MDDVVLMGESQRRGDLLRDLDDPVVFHGPFLFDDVAEHTSFDQFHYDVIDVPLASDIVNVHDIRMSKPCCCLCLSSETLGELIVLDKFRFQDLDRYESFQDTASGFVYYRHTAFADFFQ